MCRTRPHLCPFVSYLCVLQAIRLLHVSRVDHGVRAVEDPELMEHLRVTRLPLTVCPVSNLKLKVGGGRRRNSFYTWKHLVRLAWATRRPKVVCTHTPAHTQYIPLLMNHSSPRLRTQVLM